MEEKEIVLTEESATEQKEPVKKMKTKKCPVLAYNEELKELDFLFDGYGIKEYDVEHFSGETVNVKYQGKIGTKGFVYQLVK
jgi:hypothetical protein